MGIDAPAMLADAVPRHAQGRGVAALPTDDQAERVVLDTNNNLLDQRADDPFAGCWRGARAVPGPLEISAEREQRSRSVAVSAVWGLVASVSRSSSNARMARRRSFQHRSSSAATRRLSGSTASYCRRARAAS